MVTAGGALLLGALGAQLEAAEAEVAAAAWSDDGALLAFARREGVTVRELAGGRGQYGGFTTRIMSGVPPAAAAAACLPGLRRRQCTCAPCAGRGAQPRAR